MDLMNLKCWQIWFSKFQIYLHISPPSFFQRVKQKKKKRKVQHEYLMLSRTVTRHVYGNLKSSWAAVFRTGNARMQQLLPGFSCNESSFHHFPYNSLRSMVVYAGRGTRLRKCLSASEYSIIMTKLRRLTLLALDLTALALEHHHRHTLQTPHHTLLCTEVILDLYVTTCSSIETSSDHG